MEEIAIAILAAGDGSRFGGPKQLAKLDDKPLLHHCIDTALDTHVKKILVVLGAKSNLIINSLHVYDHLIKEGLINIIINTKWEVGLSESIKISINHLKHKWPVIESIMFLAADQPFITSTHLLQLMEKKRNHKAKIVATSYASIIGIPAVFDQIYFEKLLSLKGDMGAGSLIKDNINEVHKIHLEQAAFDIDTIEELERYNHLKSLKK